jgi:hypothetical protein
MFLYNHKNCTLSRNLKIVLQPFYSYNKALNVPTQSQKHLHTVSLVPATFSESAYIKSYPFTDLPKL